ncbi:uncharacterized protein LOC142609052 [Castanea sativa]|uniref:uncharacterized protein LOC142609052 n=1 Tax=Castanea sativa TaxID=21020 RepID=UPI003F64F252
MSRPPLGTIGVILAKPGRESGKPSRVMSVRVGLGNEANKRDCQLAKRMKLSAIPILGFSEEDKKGTCQLHDDALVVTIRIEGYDVKRVLIDDGSGAKIMYPELFRGLNLKVEDLEKYDSPLVGFDGKSVIPQGMIKLPVQVEDEEVQVNFIVVSAYSPYTAILARLWLHAMGAILLTLHVKVKYPTDGRGADLEGSSAEELQRVFIGGDKERYFQVGSQLPVLEKMGLIKFLEANINVFAWTMYDILRIDPEFICHRLNVNPEAIPHKQPPQRASQDHAEAVKEEVNKLKQAGAIKEIFYPEWLANTVVVKKKNGKWRVCVNFTDLNKVCPKDPFPILRIDQLVDAIVGHPRMSFLDAFQGYHQIPISLADQEKIAFRAPNGNYHYRVMPFGLKNAGSTYQRMVTRMFEEQLGRNM